MASPGDQQGSGDKQPPEQRSEPPAKMVRLDELESSIEKIVERSLLKAARGQTNPPTSEAPTTASSTGKEGPPP